MNNSQSPKLTQNAKRGFIEALTHEFGLVVPEDKVTVAPCPGNIYCLDLMGESTHYVGHFLAHGVPTGAGTCCIDAIPIGTTVASIRKYYEYAGNLS